MTFYDYIYIILFIYHITLHMIFTGMYACDVSRLLELQARHYTHRGLVLGVQSHLGTGGLLNDVKCYNSDPKTKVTWSGNVMNFNLLSCKFCASADSLLRRLQATWVCFCTSSVGFYNFSVSQWVQGLDLDPFVFACDLFLLLRALMTLMGTYGTQDGIEIETVSWTIPVAQNWLMRSIEILETSGF